MTVRSGDPEGTVRAFFSRTVVAGLLLPDGWFGGRAMEGQHRLTFLAVRPKRLLIELDDQLLLSVAGFPDVRCEVSTLAQLSGTDTLVIEGYRQCVLEFLAYGSDEPHSQSWTAGRVTFVAPT